MKSHRAQSIEHLWTEKMWMQETWTLIRYLWMDMYGRNACGYGEQLTENKLFFSVLC